MSKQPNHPAPAPKPDAQPVQAALLWPILDALGMHAEPYPGGGVQAFIGRADIAQPALYRSLWSLADAVVVGTLAGPALHIMPRASLQLARGETK